MTTILVVMFAILALLQVMDGLSTQIILGRGGRELNPILRWSFDQIGFWPSIAVKGAIILALTYAVTLTTGSPTVLMMIAVYTAVIFWNLLQIK